MKDTSNTRRSLGKIGIIAAAAIILPLTATIVPAVVAQDKVATEEGKPEAVKREVRIIKLKRDGETVDIVGHDTMGGEVTKIERDGKTFIFRTDKKLSPEDVEKLIDGAEKSQKEAEVVMVQADSTKDAEGNTPAPAKSAVWKPFASWATWISLHTSPKSTLAKSRKTVVKASR